ncbi:hypothetical protein AURDEDRAFT_181292 [Auricularia subglabra TFB-10046 SS5]|nr:hypothetical protein AURDEDRAFT_181292 [Auricularia subglabra TFB-10046 SS5]
MAESSRRLMYTLPITLKDSAGGDARTFSVTLPSEALDGVGRITIDLMLDRDPADDLNYPLEHRHRTNKEVAHNSLGLMRYSVIEEGPGGPLTSTSWAVLEARLVQARRNATGYKTNPRNLEAFWKPVYRCILLIVIDQMGTCDVREEIPIWAFSDARDQMPLTATVAMPRGGGKTVFPDLNVVMHVPLRTHDDHVVDQEEYMPILAELKRAVSRSLTVQGYPDRKRPEGRRQLVSAFRVAQRQIELVACIQLRKVDQPHIILFVAVGPWCRAALVSRDDLLGMAAASMSEKEIAYQINEVLEPQLSDASNDGVPSENDSTQTPDREFVFQGSHFDNLSTIPKWTTPAMLGTPEADRLVRDMRRFVRLMMTFGRVPNL